MLPPCSSWSTSRRNDGNKAAAPLRDPSNVLRLPGLPPNDQREVDEAKAAGVHKFNADTDLRHAFRAGFEAVWATGDRQLEDAMAEGRTRMIDATIEKMKSYGCAGRSSLESKSAA